MARTVIVYVTTTIGIEVPKDFTEKDESAPANENRLRRIAEETLDNMVDAWNEGCSYEPPIVFIRAQPFDAWEQKII